MSITFDFSALEVQKRNIKPAMQAKVNNLIFKHSVELYKRYLKRLPYCTGFLIKSADIDFKYDSRGWAFVNIDNDAVYAKWIEDGTVDSDGNFALALSISETTQNLKRDLARPSSNLLKTKRKQPPRAESLGNITSGECKNPK